MGFCIKRAIYSIVTRQHRETNERLVLFRNHVAPKRLFLAFPAMRLLLFYIIVERFVQAVLLHETLNIPDRTQAPVQECSYHFAPFQTSSDRKMDVVDRVAGTEYCGSEKKHSIMEKVIWGRLNGGG